MRAFGAVRSCNDVRNHAVLEGQQPVLERQLLLLHALNCQRIARLGDHSVYRYVKIRVFLPETCKFETNLGLFLFRHSLPVCRLQVDSKVIDRSGLYDRLHSYTTDHNFAKCC